MSRYVIISIANVTKFSSFKSKKQNVFTLAQKRHILWCVVIFFSPLLFRLAIDESILEHTNHPTVTNQYLSIHTAWKNYSNHTSSIIRMCIFTCIFTHVDEHPCFSGINITSASDGKSNGLTTFNDVYTLENILYFVHRVVVHTLITCLYVYR